MEQKTAAPATPVSRSKLPLVIGAAVLLASASAGGWYAMNIGFGAGHGDAGATTPGTAHADKAPAQYYPLHPAFVVNLADDYGTRYLQVDVELMSRDPLMTDVLKQHAPLIRNRLMLLFSQKQSTELRTRADKERLQAEALAETRKILQEEAGKTGIEALYFTSFVTQ